MTLTAPGVGDILTGGSTPVATWNEKAPDNISVGHYYNGIVVKEETVQQTKMLRPGQTTAELEFWDPPTNNRPKWQIIVTLQNDAYATEDNPHGHLRVFLKGGQLIAAQQKAKELGIDSFLHGQFQIRWTGTKPAKTAGYNDAKTFEVDFIPGVSPLQASVLGGSQEQWAASPPPMQAPQQQPVVQQIAPQQQAPQQGFAAPPALQQAPQQPAVGINPPPASQPLTFPPAPPAGAAAVTSILGAVEVTPLTPDMVEKVKQVHAAGYNTSEAIIGAFKQYGIDVTVPQVEQALGGTPV